MIKIDKINMPEVLRYLGYKGTGYRGEILQGIINEAADECLANIRPSYMYRLFPVTIDEDTINFTGSSLSLKSKNLADNYQRLHYVALLCATIGSAFDNKLKNFPQIVPLFLNSQDCLKLQIPHFCGFATLPSSERPRIADTDFIGLECSTVKDLHQYTFLE